MGAACPPVRTDGRNDGALISGTGCQYRPIRCPRRPAGAVPPLSSQSRSRGGSPMDEQRTEEPLVEETLVEEVSIDGMCGVY
ncbi:mycofactocin precursor MftA [Pseudonocardia nematodicida]